GPHRRAPQGRPAATAQPRHAWHAGARRHAQPHLAPDRGAAAVSAALARWPRRLAVTVVGLVAWELLYRTGLIRPVIFGAPSLVYAAALKDGGTFLAALRVTGGEVLVAAAIAWVGGIAFGVLIGAAPLPALVFAPVLSGVIALPLIVLYPVLVAWLGIGIASKVAYGAAAGFFPVALAALLGMRSID